MHRRVAVGGVFSAVATGDFVPPQTSLLLAAARSFGASMFLSPIFSSIPPYATGPAIVLVGALMFEHARHGGWHLVWEAPLAWCAVP